MEPDSVFEAIEELHRFTEFSIGNLSRDLGGRMARVEGRVDALHTTTQDGFREVRERLTALERSAPHA